MRGIVFADYLPWDYAAKQRCASARERGPDAWAGGTSWDDTCVMRRIWLPPRRPAAHYGARSEGLGDEGVNNEERGRWGEQVMGDHKARGLASAIDGGHAGQPNEGRARDPAGATLWARARRFRGGGGGGGRAGAGARSVLPLPLVLPPPTPPTPPTPTPTPTPYVQTSLVAESALRRIPHPRYDYDCGVTSLPSAALFPWPLPSLARAGLLNSAARTRRGWAGERPVSSSVRQRSMVRRMWVARGHLLPFLLVVQDALHHIPVVGILQGREGSRGATQQSPPAARELKTRTRRLLAGYACHFVVVKAANTCSSSRKFTFGSCMPSLSRSISSNCLSRPEQASSPAPLMFL